ncbi:MAG TPA: hypothetical protein VF845_09950 [Terriglobales bacterium]|jgi:hypothetical protein
MLLGARAAEISPMIREWTTPYRAALREPDPAKLPELCEQARYAINMRVLELGWQGADAPERRLLEESLRHLAVHESKRKPTPFSPLAVAG